MEKKTAANKLQSNVLLEIDPRSIRYDEREKWEKEEKAPVLPVTADSSGAVGIVICVVLPVALVVWILSLVV